MTDERNEETVVDAIYDNEQIYHVLEPNEEGVRGVPSSQYLIRDRIENVRVFLANLDQTKIDEFINQN